MSTVESGLKKVGLTIVYVKKKSIVPSPSKYIIYEESSSHQSLLEPKSKHPYCHR